MRSQRLIMPFVLPLLIFLFGCSEDSAVTPSNDTASHYFPLEVGSVWTYVDADGDTVEQREVMDSYSLDGLVAYEMRRAEYGDNGPNFYATTQLAHYKDALLTRMANRYGMVSWWPVYILHPDSVGVELEVPFNQGQTTSIRLVEEVDKSITIAGSTYSKCLQVRVITSGIYDCAGFWREYYAPGIGLVARYTYRSFGAVPTLDYYLLSYKP